MKDIDRLDQRLIDLEIKFGFTEDLVESLNQVIIRQQRQIDLLVGELSRLRDEAGESSASGHPRTLRDDLPPHY